MSRKEKKQESSKFSLRHEITGHQGMLVYSMADRRKFNEGDLWLWLLSQLAL